MSYRLIAIDVDGTLLTTRRTVTPRTVRAIETAIMAGKRVALCTGRSFHSARSIAEQVHPSTSLIFHSGALIFESLNGPLLRAVNLPRDLAFDIVDYCKQAGYDPLVYDPVPESRHIWYEPARRPNEWRSRYIEANTGRACLIADLREAPVMHPAQIAVAGHREEIERLRMQLGRRWPQVGMILSRSTMVAEYWFMEVVPSEVSKAQALEFLGAAFGIRPAEMIGVGDNFNDLDMIAYAGLGVAMDNAPDDVKAAADLVAPSNDEEGVAYVIERFLL
jgi:Cof subfamily protein (haloacid dehalogenase superfamily)